MSVPIVGVDVLFVGARSHAKICHRILAGQKPFWSFPLVYDEDETVAAPWADCIVDHDWNTAITRAKALSIKHFVVALGNERRGKRRCELAEHVFEVGLDPLRVISPRSIIGGGVKVDDGLQILQGAMLGDEVTIGKWCLIGAGAIVEHESVLENGVTVMTGAVVNGGVRIKKHATICANATVLPGLTIGEGAIVGAGAVVTRDVLDHFVVVGSPARPTWQERSKRETAHEATGPLDAERQNIRTPCPSDRRL